MRPSAEFLYVLFQNEIQKDFGFENEVRIYEC